MLLKKHRIPKNAKWLGIVAKRQTQQFSLTVSKNDVGIVRFQIAIPKRVDKRAVVRNRIKRQIMLCAEPFCTKKTGLDVRIFARPAMLTLSHEAMCATISQVLTPLIV